MNSQVHCPKCGSTEITFQAVSDVSTQRRGCLGWLIWIILAICTFGLIIIIPLITNSKNKTKVHTVAICQHCGHRWNV